MPSKPELSEASINVIKEADRAAHLRNRPAGEPADLLTALIREGSTMRNLTASGMVAETINTSPDALLTRRLGGDMLPITGKELVDTIVKKARTLAQEYGNAYVEPGHLFLAALSNLGVRGTIAWASRDPYDALRADVEETLKDIHPAGPGCSNADEVDAFTSWLDADRAADMGEVISGGHRYTGSVRFDAEPAPSTLGAGSPETATPEPVNVWKIFARTGYVTVAAERYSIEAGGVLTLWDAMRHRVRSYGPGAWNNITPTGV